MTDKNKKGIFIAAVAVAIVGTTSIFLFKNKKVQYAKTIVKYGGSRGYATLLTFGEDYLQAWAAALKKGKETFELNGSKYYTQGGLLVK